MADRVIKLVAVRADSLTTGDILQYKDSLFKVEAVSISTLFVSVKVGDRHSIAFAPYHPVEIQVQVI